MGYLNGFIEEMVDGIKVVKVFNHEKENSIEFDYRNQELYDSAVEALTYSGRTIPTVVSISFSTMLLSQVSVVYLLLMELWI